jgi:Holliday junction DNA helicase RuvA
MNGVGYEDLRGADAVLPAVGEIVTLAIDTHLREDRSGCTVLPEHERAWFRAPQIVQGVGAKVALAVLGTPMPPTSPMPWRCRTRPVARAPGVGPKVAARIVAELKTDASLALRSGQAA